MRCNLPQAATLSANKIVVHVLTCMYFLGAFILDIKRTGGLHFYFFSYIVTCLKDMNSEKEDKLKACTFLLVRLVACEVLNRVRRPCECREWVNTDEILNPPCAPLLTTMSLATCSFDSTAAFGSSRCAFKSKGSRFRSDNLGFCCGRFL